MGSNYAPTLHVQKEAAERGFQQVLWLYGDDHQVTEVGTMNIFMFYINDQGGEFCGVKYRCLSNLGYAGVIFTLLLFLEKELVTPPLNGLILPGITRNSILTVSREWNQFKVTERIITMPEIIRLLSENRVSSKHVQCCLNVHCGREMLNIYSSICGSVVSLKLLKR